MPRVYNIHHRNAPSTGAVYVGRPTKWGNPFSHLVSYGTVKVANRDEAVEHYKSRLLSNPTMIAEAKVELRGKDLVCWCAPARCHADVLLEIANQGLET